MWTWAEWEAEEAMTSGMTQDGAHTWASGYVDGFEGGRKASPTPGEGKVNFISLIWDRSTNDRHEAQK